MKDKNIHLVLISGSWNPILVQRKNLNQAQIKIRILAYLFSRKEGATQHDLQSNAVSGHVQEASRFRNLLDELYRSEHVNTIHVDNGRVIYKITDNGKKAIEKYRDTSVKESL